MDRSEAEAAVKQTERAFTLSLMKAAHKQTAVVKFGRRVDGVRFLEDLMRSVWSLKLCSFKQPRELTWKCAAAVDCACGPVVFRLTDVHMRSVRELRMDGAAVESIADVDGAGQQLMDSVAQDVCGGRMVVHADMIAAGGPDVWRWIAVSARTLLDGLAARSFGTKSSVEASSEICTLGFLPHMEYAETLEMEAAVTCGWDGGFEDVVLA